MNEMREPVINRNDFSPEEFTAETIERRSDPGTCGNRTYWSWAS